MSNTVFMPASIAKGIPCGELLTVKDKKGKTRHYVTLSATNEDSFKNIKVAELPVKTLNIDTSNSNLPRLNIIG